MILTLDVYTAEEAVTGYGIDRALARPAENCVQAVACDAFAMIHTIDHALEELR